MSDPNTLENSPETPKKGLSPLVWAGIGCGGIVILGLIFLVIGGMFLGNKVKQGLADANGNPERFAVEMIVKFNPDMEIVETDDEEEGTITVKMTKTGEVHTFSYADIQDGKFSVESTTAEGKTTSIKHDGQTMKINDGKGKTTVVSAAKKGDYWANLPEDLKGFAYPNISGVASPLTTVEDDFHVKVTLMFITQDAEADILKFYQEKLEAENYTLKESSDLMGKELQGNKGTQLLKVTIIEQGNGNAVMFYAEQSK